MLALSAAAGQLRGMGCRPIAISCDSMFTLRAFADEHALGLDLLSDHWPHGAIAQAYGCFDSERGVAGRCTVLIDPEGAIRWRQQVDLGERRDLAEAIGALQAARGGGRSTSVDQPAS